MLKTVHKTFVLSRDCIKMVRKIVLFAILFCSQDCFQCYSQDCFVRKMCFQCYPQDCSQDCFNAIRKNVLFARRVFNVIRKIVSFARFVSSVILKIVLFARSVLIVIRKIVLFAGYVGDILKTATHASHKMTKDTCSSQ